MSTTPSPSLLRLCLGIAVALLGIVLLFVLSRTDRGLLFLDAPHRWTVPEVATAFPGLVCFLIGFYAAAVDLHLRGDRVLLFLRGNPLVALLVLVLGAGLLIPLRFSVVRRRRTASAMVALATAMMTALAVGLVVLAVGISSARSSSPRTLQAERSRVSETPSIAPVAPIAPPAAPAPTPNPAPVLAPPTPVPPAARPARKPPVAPPADMFD